MEERASGLLTMDDPDAGLHLPPNQTPPNARRIARLRRAPATVGTVDDAMARLAQAMLVQYGPISVLVKEIMERQMAVEDFCCGEIDTEGLKARIALISTKAQMAQNAVREDRKDEATPADTPTSNGTSDAPPQEV